LRLFARLFGRSRHQKSLIESIPRGATRYFVARWIDDRYYLAYDGPNGGEARRRYEFAVTQGERGKTEFWMDNGGGPVMRSSHEGRA
jgi:hypothetical protein